MIHRLTFLATEQTTAIGECRPTPHDLRIQVLGPLTIHKEGADVQVGPVRRRALLLRLLLANGASVPTDTLREDLWGGAESVSASTVHAHISRLRSMLHGGDPDGPLVREVGGYQLRCGELSTDVHQAEEATAQARRSLSDGRPDLARQAVDEALRLWRGPALAEVRDYDFAAGEAARLDELHAAVQEFAVQAATLTGDTVTAVSEARVLTNAYPLRESAWMVLLRALGAAGRFAEALRSYADLRSLLSEQLGTEPSPALRAMHRHLLDQDARALFPRTPQRKGRPFVQSFC